MRAVIALALGLALAVVGSFAVAGSSYTPPAASGGGVEGDGTGVTDASAFRSALGLGTAATLTAGTAANNAVQLDGSGRLPAVDGSQLTGISATPSASTVPYAPASAGDWANPDPTEVAGALDTLAARMIDVEAVTTDPEVSSLADLEWSSGTQIPAYLGSGTASLLSVGSGALNIVQLDADSKLPAVDGSALTGVSASPYAADSWDAVWEAADGATGWTTSGTATTNGIATTAGKSTWTVTTASSNSAYAYRSLTSAPDNSFEIRANVYITAQMTASDPNGWVMFTAFGKLIRVVISSTGVAMYTAAGGSSPTGTTGAPLGKWMTVTLRVTSPDTNVAAPTTSAVTAELWVGEVFVGSTQVGLAVGAGGSTYEADGALTVGTTTSTSTVALAWVAVREGHNAALPSYTYRGLGYAPDVAAP